MGEKMQHIAEILGGQRGLAGMQQLLTGTPMADRLHTLLCANLDDATQVVACHLQRAKFKPGRKLTAYYDLHLQRQRDVGVDIRPLAVTWTLPEITRCTERKAGEDVNKQHDHRAVQAEAGRRGLAAPFQQLTLTAAELGMTLHISPFDPHYPQLVRLADPRYVRERFSTAGNTAHGALPTEACDYTVTPVRYRPGQRHVLRYDPVSTTTRPSGQGTIFAKLYADATGQGLYSTIHQVADWLATHTTAVTVLRPQAYLWAEMVLLYPWVKGVPLVQWLATSAGPVDAALRQVGAALRLLHSAPASVTQGLPAHTIDAEIKSLMRTCEHIQLLLPVVGQTIQRLSEQVQAQYAALPQEAPTFVHGDWKADHVLVAPHTAAPLTLIDFDSCALADPALDIGKFLADLAWWYTTRQQPGLAQAQKAFLAGYNLDPSHPRLRRAQLWAALIGVKMTAHRVPLFDGNWAGATTALINQYAGNAARDGGVPGSKIATAALH